MTMRGKKWVNPYLKWAAIFGVAGWSTFFMSVALAAFKFFTYAAYMATASIIIGWGISGYFWIRYGMSQGKNVREVLRERLWFKTKKHSKKR